MSTAALLGAAPGVQAAGPEDLRSPDAREAARQMRAGDVQDLRSPDAKDSAALGVRLPAPARAADPGGLDWGDAAVGGGMAMGLVGLAGVTILARRRVARPSTSGRSVRA